MRQRTILHPTCQSWPNYRPCEADYISVNRIDTYGTWSVWEIVTTESKAALARWANAAELKKREYESLSANV